MTSTTAKATSAVCDPGRVVDLAVAIVRGELSPVTLVERCLGRMRDIDGRVEAWRVVDAEGALAAARRLEADAQAGRIRGSLHGIPIAVKDIVDVEGVPTRANCRAREASAPASADAEIVLALRRQGAIVLGKTHTTEYAFFDPSPARNPHNTDHTPGGSSSGSAAAVAAGMVPLAIGTQTVASVNRPAAYCGVAGFKPSTRSMPTFGITPLSPGYDTAGMIGWSVDDAVRGFEAMAPAFALARPAADEERPIRIALIEDPQTSDATADVRSALTATADALARGGHTVEPVRSPASLEALAELQRSTMLYEMARALRHLLAEPAGSVGAKLLEAIGEGLAIDAQRYLAERAAVDEIRTRFFAALSDVDVCLYPATPDTAPKGLAWTGDRRYIAPWTALGGPVVSMPAGSAASGLPIGVLVAGHPGSDREMTTWARRIALIAERH